MSDFDLEARARKAVNDWCVMNGENSDGYYLGDVDDPGHLLHYFVHFGRDALQAAEDVVRNMQRGSYGRGSDGSELEGAADAIRQLWEGR